MAVTVATFTETFPEFSSYGFSTSAIQFWIDYAKVFLNPAIWGNEAEVGQPLSPFDYGVLWHSAHHVAVAISNAGSPKINPATGQAIGLPGSTSGVVTGKTVDKVSVQSDASLVAEEAAGHWNKTTYGTMFARLARQFGNAPRYVSGSSGQNPHAWAGPGYPFPGWFAW